MFSLVLTDIAWDLHEPIMIGIQDMDSLKKNNPIDLFYLILETCTKTAMFILV